MEDCDRGLSFTSIQRLLNGKRDEVHVRDRTEGG
jgi:hypothetical protein